MEYAEKPPIHRNVQGHQEQHDEGQRRMLKTAPKGAHGFSRGVSNAYPTPRIVRISETENGRSIFARRARMWTSTIFVIESYRMSQTCSIIAVRVSTRSALRRRYSRSAYSLLVNTISLSPLQTRWAAGSNS